MMKLTRYYWHFH